MENAHGTMIKFIIITRAFWQVINTRRGCAARVTVVVVSVCLSVKSNLTSGASDRRENATKYSACNEGQNICGVFSETVSFQSYGTSCFVRLPCSRPLLSAEYAHALLKCTLTVGRGLGSRRRPQVLPLAYM